MFKYSDNGQVTCSSSIKGSSSIAYSAEVKSCPSKENRYTGWPHIYNSPGQTDLKVKDTFTDGIARVHVPDTLQIWIIMVTHR